MCAFFEIYDERFKQLVDVTCSPEQIASGFIWVEGPVWLDQTLYFNDIPAKKMISWKESTGVAIALKNSEFANGNTIDRQGYMVTCEHGGRRVIRRHDPEDLQAIEIIADQFEGKRLNSPNDVVVRTDGTIWFTDPPYGINSDVEGYPADSEIEGNYVFCCHHDGHVTAVATDFYKPNGLAFSPEEDLLYIADSGAIRGASFPEIDYSLPHHIRVFDVNGTDVSGGGVFAEISPGAPDGIRVDHHGNIWSSAMDGIHCLDPNGRRLGKIRLPSQTSNLCFGGLEGTDIFITASDKVWRVRSNIRDAAHVSNNSIKTIEG